jgi:hypothetical protein
MPTPIDSLSPKSSDAQIRDAISACIAIEIDTGRAQSQDQAIGMCFDMARRKTGKKISRGGE